MPKTPLDHLEAEAKADPNAPVTVRIWGDVFEVKPVGKWKTSGLRALREGDLDSWAEKSMDLVSYKKWQAKDPDIEEAGQFMTAWESVAGENVPSS